MFGKGRPLGCKDLSWGLVRRRGRGAAVVPDEGVRVVGCIGGSCGRGFVISC